MAVISNPALERMRAGDTALGMIVRLCPTPEIALVARQTGHDFLFIDMQHGAMSMETVAAISVAALGAGIAPVVRVRSSADPDIARLLDAGAMGIVVPDVESAADAARAVAAARFAPVGRRSVSSGYPALGFAPTPAGEAASALNGATMLVCMIESRKGVDNLDEIAAIDGVDVLHFGCNDFLYDIGRPGDFTGPEVASATGRLIEACDRHGRFAGLGGDKDPDRQRAYIRRGFRFVTANSDLAYLTASATSRVANLRDATKT